MPVTSNESQIMPITTSRRDILRFVGGSLAGLIFTPIPWRLLDDIAIRTQNPPWTVETPRGEIFTKFSTCTMCPAGCGIKVCCIADHPISLSGIPNHPLSQGTLCPSGLGGHHVPYHPLRIIQSVKISRKDGDVRAEQASLSDVIANLQSAIANSAREGSVAILDQRPGRTVSTLYRKFLAQLPNGRYLVPPGEGDLAFSALSQAFVNSTTPLGLDLEGTRTILSFGTPILDGWITSGRLQKLLRSRENGGEDAKLKIVQIETRRSRTAMQADRWIPIKPSSEAAFALGLANVIISENLYDHSFVNRHASDFSAFRALVRAFPIERVVELSGISANTIVDTARMIAKRSPAVVIGCGDPGSGTLGSEAEAAIAGLNLMMGNVGKQGGFVSRNEEAVGSSIKQSKLVAISEFASIPDQSIRVLIIDGTEGTKVLPWNLIEPKLTSKNSLVVTLSPYLSELARRSDYVIPTTAHMESLTDVPTPFDAATATFALGAPIIQPPIGVIQSIEVINQLSSSTESLEQHLKQKVEAIHKSKRGTIFNFADGSSTPNSTIASADDLWKRLNGGAIWIDSRRKQTAPKTFSFLGHADLDRFQKSVGTYATMESQSRNEKNITLIPYGYSAAVGSGQLSPLMSKLYQESNLRRGKHSVSIHPSSGALLDMHEGDKAIMATSKGACEVSVHFDSAVMPGTGLVSVGPDPVDFVKNGTRLTDGPLDIVEMNGTTWNTTSAILRKA